MFGTFYFGAYYFGDSKPVVSARPEGEGLFGGSTLGGSYFGDAQTITESLPVPPIPPEPPIYKRGGSGSGSGVEEARQRAHNERLLIKRARMVELCEQEDLELILSVWLNIK